MALLLALPFAGGGSPAAHAETQDVVQAPPMEAEVPEVGETELTDPSLQLVFGDVGAPEDELPAASPEAETTAQPEATIGPEGVEAIEPVVTPEPTPEPLKLAESSVKLGVKETHVLTFQGGVKAASVGARFTTSNKRVVTVNSKTGKLRGRGVGTATVTAKLPDGTSCTCKVKVRKAPKKVTLSPAKATLGVKETMALKAKLPTGTASAITYRSSNTKVARVDETGLVTTLKKGTATITATTFNGKKATCKIKVKKAPKTVSVGFTTLELWDGDTYKLKPFLSANSAGACTVTTSDAAVVSVKDYTLTANAIGTATVTVTTYNGKSVNVAVSVSRRPVYRALLIGESDFPGTGMGSLPGKKDAARMKKMLASVKGPAGGDWAVTIRYNRMSSKIHSDIVTAFAGAQEGDVSLFYISTHGDEIETMDGFNSEYAGCLYTYPNPGTSDWYERNVLTLSQLAEWLKEVPGQVIVFIDSCGSGAAIYSPKGKGVMAAPEMDPVEFNEAVVDAFASRDRAVMAASDQKGAFVVHNKFYVLTSTAYLETGWSSSNNYSYFTKWLTDGIGTSGEMIADADGNAVTTLNELYGYVSKRAEIKVFEYHGEKYQQHVQVYPSGSSFGLFRRD